MRELVVARTGVSISSHHPPHLTKPTTSWHGASGGITRTARPPHCNGIGCRRDRGVLRGPSRTLDKDQRTPTDTRVATNSCDAACDGWLCCLRFLACVPFDVTVWMCGSLKKHSETEMPHPPKMFMGTMAFRNDDAVPMLGRHALWHNAMSLRCLISSLNQSQPMGDLACGPKTHTVVTAS